jgi:hypothetical protein
LFVTHAVLELEADLIAACAERKADLLRRADQYEKEGLHAVAEQLRQQAERLSPDKPLGTVVAITAHLQFDTSQSGPTADAGSPESPAAQAERLESAPKKKNGKF